MLMDTTAPFTRASENAQPGRTCLLASPSGRVRSSAAEACYYFGADAAEEAASAAALAALASLAAADGGDVSAAGAGGVVSAAGAGGASVLPPQALNTTTATKALRASLVFIYRYPENI